jgi:hypothetical protein
MESLVTQSVKEGIEVLTGGERTDRRDISLLQQS